MVTPSPPTSDGRSRRTLLAADLVRAAGVASFLVALTAMGGIATALFALVLLGLTLPRVAAVPPLLDLGTGVVLVFAAWCSLLDYYQRYPWLDVVVHAVATGLLSLVAFWTLVRAEVVAAPWHASLARAGAGAVLLVTCVGCAFGVLWEAGEWYGHTFLDPRIQTGYADTVADLAVGAVGALVAGLALLPTSRSPRQHAPAPAHPRQALEERS